VKVNTRDLIDYAVREKHVHIVSPTSFYAYLQTIVQGLRALQIEERTKEIKKRVEMLAGHLAVYGDCMNKVGIHLGTTVSVYNKATKEFAKMDKDVVKITGGQSNLEIQGEVEKPILEE